MGCSPSAHEGYHEANTLYRPIAPSAGNGDYYVQVRREQPEDAAAAQRRKSSQQKQRKMSEATDFLKMQNTLYRAQLYVPPLKAPPSPIIPDMSSWPIEPEPINKVMIGRHNSDIQHVGRNILANKGESPEIAQQVSARMGAGNKSGRTSAQPSIKQMPLRQSIPGGRTSAHRASYQPAEPRTPRGSLQVGYASQQPISLKLNSDPTGSRKSVQKSNLLSASYAKYSTPRNSVQLENYLPNVPMTPRTSIKTSTQDVQSAATGLPVVEPQRQVSILERPASPFKSAPTSSVQPLPKLASAYQTSDYSDAEPTLSIQTMESASQLSIHTMKSKSKQSVKSENEKPEIKMENNPSLGLSASEDANGLHFSIMAALAPQGDASHWSEEFQFANANSQLEELANPKSLDANVPSVTVQTPSRDNTPSPWQRSPMATTPLPSDVAPSPWAQSRSDGATPSLRNTSPSPWGYGSSGGNTPFPAEYPMSPRDITPSPWGYGSSGRNTPFPAEYQMSPRDITPSPWGQHSGVNTPSLRECTPSPWAKEIPRGSTPAIREMERQEEYDHSKQLENGVSLCMNTIPVHTAQDILLGTSNFPWEASAVVSTNVNKQEAIATTDCVLLDRQDFNCNRRIELQQQIQKCTRSVVKSASMKCVHTLCQSEIDPCITHGMIECTPQTVEPEVEAVTPAYALSTYHDSYANAETAEEWRRTVRVCMDYVSNFYESAQYVNSYENEAAIVQPACSARPLLTKNRLLHQVYDISPTVYHIRGKNDPLECS